MCCVFFYFLPHFIIIFFSIDFKCGFVLFSILSLPANAHPELFDLIISLAFTVFLYLTSRREGLPVVCCAHLTLPLLSELNFLLKRAFTCFWQVVTLGTSC